jgi:hypothetical protein
MSDPPSFGRAKLYSARFSARLWLARRRTRFLVTRVAALSSPVLFEADWSAPFGVIFLSAT